MRPFGSLARRIAQQSRRPSPRSAAAFSTATEKDRLVIFDTTCRDGEQSPGAALTELEKVDICKQLSRLGVDVCEAGFPIASEGDFQAVSQVAKTAGVMTEGRYEGRPMRIAGLSRANKKDIERCYNAVKHAPLHRIHTFLASSDIHLEHKLGITRARCVELASEMVAFAKSLTDDIEFSPEDAGRSDPAFLAELCTAVIEAGATTINLPDTVGYTVPDEYAGMFAYLIAEVPGASNVIWSTHCHNDLGLATANSLAAVQSGARQVEVTLNSLGERAGNTSLEEVVMALRTRPHLFPVHCTGIDTKQIMRTSRMVATYTGIAVQANKAIVGANAFAHESGIHQHGVLKHAATYEIITPESVGAGSELVLGKLSGKAAYKQRLIELGFESIANDEEQLVKLVEGAKAVADQKKVISDDDLRTLLGVAMDSQGPITWRLHRLHVAGDAEDEGKKVSANAMVTLVNKDGETITDTAMGAGPVDATFKAILRMIELPVKLTAYNVTKIHGGSGGPGNDALASIVLRVQRQDAQPQPHDTSFPGGQGAMFFPDKGGSDSVAAMSNTSGMPIFVGTGSSTDIVVASAQAYLGAVNKLIAAVVGDACFFCGGQVPPPPPPCRKADIRGTRPSSP